MIKKYIVRDFFIDIAVYVSVGFLVGRTIGEEPFLLLPLGFITMGFVYYKFIKRKEKKNDNQNLP